MGGIIRRLWVDPVWSKVISAGILALIGSTGWLFWEAIVAAGSATAAFLTASTSIPNWLLIALTCAGILIIGLAGIVGLAAFGKGSGPSWREYRHDNFLGIGWRWRYGQSGEIYSLVPYCPRCDFQIIPHHASGYRVVPGMAFECEHCRQFNIAIEYDMKHIEGLVERSIHHKLRGGGWKKELPNSQ